MDSYRGLCHVWDGFLGWVIPNYVVSTDIRDRVVRLQTNLDNFKIIGNCRELHFNIGKCILIT